MIKPLAGILLLILLVFGAGCVNIEETNPPKDSLILGEWEGYDTENSAEYKLICRADGYAHLEIEYKHTVPEQEYEFFGTWEKNGTEYPLKLSGGNYLFTITETARTGTLTTPNGTTVSLQYDSP